MQHECRPWVVEEIDPAEGEEEPCECPERPTETPKPEEKPCSRDKKQDCCEQILEILRRGGGFRDVKIHKPKQSAKVKRANLCCKSSYETSVVPLLMLFLRRFLGNRQPENDFEKKMQNYFRGLPSNKIEALTQGLKAYDEVPWELRQCIFETRFEDCDSLHESFGPNFFLKVLLQEAIHLSRKVLFDRVPGPGKVRIWEKFFPAVDVGSTDIKLKGPWPWICQVDPKGDNSQWFKNTEVAEPGNVPLSAFIFEKHEFSRVCKEDTSKPIEPGKFHLKCENEKAPTSSVGFGGTGPCHGNLRYNFDQGGSTFCHHLKP